MAEDVGTTHVLPADLARVEGIDLSEAEAKIERGRQKLAAWIALLSNLEDYDREGCARCGCPVVHDEASCRDNQKRVAAARDRFPVERLIRMNPARWYAVVQVLERGSVVSQIQTE